MTRVPHLLKRAGRVALRSLAAGRGLLAFDFDGTLAPLADHPQAASMTRATRTLLHRLARAYPCAIISGRPRAEVMRRLGGIPLVAAAGSHGAEDGHSRPRRSPLEYWRHRVGTLARVPGVVLEFKTLGVAMHYRRAHDKAAARAAILAAVERLPGARVLEGRDVVELLPASAPNKGHALTALRRRLRPRSLLYVGDDTTDEDAFSSLGPGLLISVRVGRAEATAARFRLDDQAEVEALLRALVQLVAR
jgi:trehalose 6-phosphate phosphatase